VLIAVLALATLGDEIQLRPALLTKVNKVHKGRKAAIPVVGIFVFLKFCQCHTLLESIGLYFISALFITLK
jgi:hypothetical protein